MNRKLSLAPRRVRNAIAALAVLGLLVALAFSLNTLFASRTKQPSQIASQRDSENRSLTVGMKHPSLTSAVDPASGIVPTNNWKEYAFPDASFKYLPSWEALREVPVGFRAEEGEMFIKECSGPILRNTKEKSTIIAVEVIKPGISDSNACWSRGDFRDSYSRTIHSLDPPRNIEVSRWKLGRKAWQGDLIQMYGFNNFHQEHPDKNEYIFALIYQAGQDDTAESTFDQVLSTFNFSDNN